MRDHASSPRIRGRWSLLAMLLPLSALLPGADDDAWASSIRPLLQSYCWECHGTEKQKGDLDLQDASTAQDLIRRSEVMGKIDQLVAGEEMPPSGSRQPTGAEREQLVRWIRLHRADAGPIIPNDPGPVVMARLTPKQYERCIHDLTGVSMSLADRLPRDGGAGEGFDNVGAAQGMSTTHIKAYISAAQGVISHARVLPGLPIEWLSAPQIEAKKSADISAALLEEWAAWFRYQIQKQNRAHMESLAKLLPPRDEWLRSIWQNATQQDLEWLIVYLHAAWEYRYRVELSHPDWTPESVATDYEIPLRPEILARLVVCLEKPTSNLYFQKLVSWWQALPAPPATATQIRSLCHERMVSWVTHQNMGGDDGTEFDGKTQGRLPFELDPATWLVHTDEPYSLLLTEGRQMFRFTITGRQDLYLLATDADDGNEGDFMIWEKGLIVREGKEVSWTEAKLLDADGRAVAWGASANPEASIPKDAIEVHAPAVLHVIFPEGTTEFRVDARADPILAKNGSMQALPLARPPSQDDMHHVPRRYLFAAPGSARRSSVLKMSHHVWWMLDNDSMTVITPSGVSGFGTTLPPDVVTHWNVRVSRPIDEQDYQSGFDSMPQMWCQTERTIRSRAAPRDLARLDHLAAQLQGTIEARDTLRDFLAKNRVKIDNPAQALTAAPPDLKSDQALAQYRSLLEAARADELHLRACAEKQLTAFAERAWRRTPASDRISPLMSLYDQARSEGLCYEASVKKAMVPVLTSPFFLFREQASRHQATAYPLAGREVAERLAFVIWGSIPDQELMSEGVCGHLGEADVLTHQITRMITDPRSKALAEDFAGQAFLFAGFDQLAGPDPKRFPAFSDSLRSEMRQESVSFFNYVLTQDRPLTEIIDSDYTFLNEDLARFYGVKGVSGANFRKVTVNQDGRGGVLGMGAFLTSTSSPLRTSPVKRGNWILSQLLGTPPPPPPAMVGQISNDEHDSAGQNIVQQMARHRNDAQCLSCHERIDPLGIALESFDPIGRHRAKLQDGSAVIDRPELADGTPLQGFSGLKQYLMQDRQRDLVMRCLCRRFLGYALGRASQPSDEALIDQVMTRLRDASWRSSALIVGILSSPQFLERRDEVARISDPKERP